MAEKFITEWFYAPMDRVKVETGIIFKDTHEEYSNRTVNFDAFAAQLNEKYSQFDAAGYDVINVLPIAMAASEQSVARNGNYLGDVGFSVTRGAIVVGKKRD